ncbi:hypothetical protein HZ326_27399 [Fusarium oxysporum f. sp. albedinis]|nr:hypothetical protein HZ326_27399 [Fusarium oxysporum f. sp. albedinis]
MRKLGKWRSCILRFSQTRRKRRLHQTATGTGKSTLIIRQRPAVTSGIWGRTRAHQQEDGILLEEEVGRLSRGKKRKAIPNPNRKFMTLAEALVAGDIISEPHQAVEETEAVEEVIEVGTAGRWVLHGTLKPGVTVIEHDTIRYCLKTLVQEQIGDWLR